MKDWNEGLGNSLIDQPRYEYLSAYPPDETTDITTDKTTSHSAMPPKNGGQAAGYSHLTDETTGETASWQTTPAKYARKGYAVVVRG
jgi:hypothetical protein